jgi:hypothetical protein
MMTHRVDDEHHSSRSVTSDSLCQDGHLSAYHAWSGDAGSRTQVRKSSTSRVYMCILYFSLPFDAPTDRLTFRGVKTEFNSPALETDLGSRSYCSYARKPP